MDPSPPQPDLTFYAVSAQVIPTLLIGYALWFRDIRPRPSLWMAALVAEMILALGATAACVMVLKSGDSTSFADFIIRWAYIFLFSGFAALLARYFLHPDDRHSGRSFTGSEASPASGSSAAAPRQPPGDGGDTEAPRSPEPRPDRPRSGAGRDEPRPDPTE